MNVALIEVPSNLGLRSLATGHVPGTWRAPAALRAAGLACALGNPRIARVGRRRYRHDAEPGTRILNGHAIRAVGLATARLVTQALCRNELPFVVGGDCSILMGALAGARSVGRIALVHLDGHSDFRHPGNHDFTNAPGAAAGMDLALASGRGEPLLTEWPGIEGPLVGDRDIVQIGEREGDEPDYAWGDIAQTAITRVSAQEAQHLNANALIDQITAMLSREHLPFWLHFDVDVLDQKDLPAVDSPGSPGLTPLVLTELLATLLAREDLIGVTMTVYDPDRDVGGSGASLLVDLIRSAFAGPNERLSPA